jgi:hypothetical protein
MTHLLSLSAFSYQLLSAALSFYQLLTLSYQLSLSADSSEPRADS